MQTDVEQFKQLRADFKDKPCFFKVAEGVKTPLADGWQEWPTDFEALEAHIAAGGNVGLRLDKTDLIIDIDIKYIEGNVSSFIEGFLFEFNLYDCYRIRTRSGGLHIFTKKDPSIDIAKYNRPRWGQIVEFKSGGQFLVAAGSYAEGGAYTIEHRGRLDVLCPDELLAAVRRDKTAESTTHETVAIDRVKALLSHLPVDDYSANDDWFKVCCAVHSGTSGSDEGRDAFLEWSGSGSGYAVDQVRGEVTAMWNRIGAKPNGINVYYLDKLVFDTKGIRLAVERVSAETDFAGISIADNGEVFDASIFSDKFRNYRVEKALKRDKRKKDSKPEEVDTMVMLQLPELTENFKLRTARSEVGVFGGLLCIPNQDRTKVMKVPPKNFANILAWVRDPMGRRINPGVGWAGGPEAVDRESFGIELAEELPQISRICSVPTWPMKPCDMYLARAEKFRNVPENADTRRLEEFLDYFNFHTTWDRVLGRSYVMLLLWNQTRKPAILVSSSAGTDGSDTGKTTLAAKMNLLIAGTEAVPKLDFDYGTKPLGQQMVDKLLAKPELLQFLVDNSKASVNISTPALEAQITSSIIEGHATGLGQREFPNNLVIVVTSHELSFSTDMANRLMNIVIDPADLSRTGWSDEVDAFILEHRDEILFGALSLLAKEPEFRTGRFMGKSEAFCDQIVSKSFTEAQWLAEKDEIKKIIDARKTGMDRTKQMFSDFDDFLKFEIEQNQGVLFANHPEIGILRSHLARIMQDFSKTQLFKLDMTAESFINQAIGKSRFIDRHINHNKNNVVVLRGEGIGKYAWIRRPKSGLINTEVEYPREFTRVLGKVVK